MNNRKKIVITGASGFLGSHLVERMKDDERYDVFALSSKPDDLRKKLGGASVLYLHKDIVTSEQASEIMKDAVVISCAYPRNSTGTVVAEGLKYIQEVFETAVESKAASIINISSQSVYSQQRTEAATEETPICLESPYAVGKYAVELMLDSICKGSETSYTSLRMASLIGPGFDQRIVNRFAIKLMAHESITVVLQPKRMGFLDVEDAVSAIIAVMGSPLEHWRSVYNVGNGQGYTVEQIYNSIAMELKSRIDVMPPIYETGRDASSTEVLFDCLTRDTGFIPKIDLNESVKRIIAHLWA